MPIFLSDRDNIVYRCYFSNKSHPDLIKKFKLYEKSSLYYAIYMKSIDRPDIPPKKGIIRTITNLSGWIIERDPTNSSNIVINAVTNSDFKGSIPQWIMSIVSSKMPKKVMNIVEEGYRRFEAEHNKQTKRKG